MRVRSLCLSLIRPGRSTSRGPVEPEFYLRGVLLESRRMFSLRRDVVPLTCTVTAFFAVQREDQLALSDDTHVVGLMIMQCDLRTGRVRSEQDVASLRLRLERVQAHLHLRKHPNVILDMQHPTI